MRLNQAGAPIKEEYISEYGQLNVRENRELLFMLIEHLNLAIWRTNATKHGNTEIQLRSTLDPNAL